MEHAIDINKVLKIFATIQEKGEKIDDEYFYKGFFASSSYDGYTISIRTQKVKLYVGFHNTFHFDSKHQADTDDFMHALINLDMSDQ